MKLVAVWALEMDGSEAAVKAAARDVDVADWMAVVMEV